MAKIEKIHGVREAFAESCIRRIEMVDDVCTLYMQRIVLNDSY
jgi:hypothetical protein